MTCITLSIAVVASSAVLVSARPTYVTRVPNGGNVVGVQALGHINVQGGGPRNSFGSDFEDADLQWTSELCAKDSDGDGQSNGHELGDPCCEFSSENNTVRWSTGVSHPGDATSMSNSSLWINIICPNSTTPGNSSTTDIPDPTQTNSTADDSTNSTTPTSDPTPSTTSAASGITPAIYTAVGVAATLIAYYL
ncbi:uncharacterized protein PHALS_10252 [Plasmopara halstedii]|uniref:Temptin Cys/Cys disulfide domain-containing protein n=1 Tax=Plasmopara halstedii TaxID=4781 RepID=A0A0P1AGW4_PLAHL|nr:uncharacterized protein PHALS_10252 [Plasmopara halstedii]CEG40029.1 hypothetical protein PHALS_10252 [Plasmopara halstedii]|eukprot:XP_024576398.1 hypothetical protein PHALS_10252 [Plasmopara halstedii]